MSRIADLLVEEGRNRAEGTRQSGQIWGTLVQQLGQIPTTYANLKDMAARRAAGLQQQTVENQIAQQKERRAEAEAKLAADRFEFEKAQAGAKPTAPDADRLALAGIEAADALKAGAQPEIVSGLIDRHADVFGPNADIFRARAATPEGARQVAELIAQRAPKTPAAQAPKTREIVVENPDGTKTTKIVEDKAGQEFLSTPAPKPQAPKEGDRPVSGSTVIAKDPDGNPAPAALYSDGYRFVAGPHRGKPVESMVEATPETKAKSSLEERLVEAMRTGDKAEEKRIRSALNARDVNMGGGGAAESVPTLTPEGLDAAALQWAKGGGMVPTGTGKAGAELRAKIINRAGELYPGLDVAANKAELRANSGSLATMQKQRDAIVSFENTAKKNIDIFLETAKHVPDTGVPLINSVIRPLASKVAGSPSQAEYETARRVAVSEIAKIVSNPNMTGVLSDSARKEVESFNPESATLAQTVAVMQLLKRDMANRKQSLDEQLKETRERTQKSPTSAGTPKRTRYDLDGKVIP